MYRLKLIVKKITLNDLIPLLVNSFTIWDNDNGRQILTSGRSATFVSRLIPDNLKSRRVGMIGYNKDTKTIEITLEDERKIW